MIKPLFDRVLLKQTNISSSALYVPKDENSYVATVVAVGKTDEVHVGDVVAYNKYASTTLTYNNEEYILIKEVDILAIIN